MFDVDEPTLPEPYALSDREDEPAFDPEAAEEELAPLSSHLDAATYRQLVLIRQLDESGHWANAGATTCAAWLSWRMGVVARHVLDIRTSDPCIDTRPTHS